MTALSHSSLLLYLHQTDGLYILLKPQKKKKSLEAFNHTKVPSNLMTCVMPDIPPPNCPWSLSGPQFPQPTAIQQRYCYPKGDADYSSQKGGALWTMVRFDLVRMQQDGGRCMSSLILTLLFCRSSFIVWNRRKGRLGVPSSPCLLLC
jgi:hypothetical protein